MIILKYLRTNPIDNFKIYDSRHWNKEFNSWNE